jgi:amidase
MPLLFNPLTATACELQRSLSDRKFNSVYLIKVYLAQIQKHNNYLHAVISTAPKANLLAKAAELDAERAAGKIRSPLHGIPILVKVSNILR